MKILQICSARELGGGEKHLADLANGLARSGHDVYAALSPSSPLIGELSCVPEQNIVELPMRNSLNIASALKLARFVREHEIEIVHAHVARDYPLAALAARRAGARLVLTRHVLFPLKGIHRLTLRRTARVIAVSQAVAEGLHAQGIFDPEKIVCIHNGIDVERFAKGSEAVANRAQAAERKLRVGMIGHLAPIKGQEDFIRAAAAVCGSRHDVEFIIAGEDKSRSGDNRRKLEKLIEELNLNQRVSLIGWVDDVAKLLPTFDLFVSPSRSEPFGLSIVEAMAGGVPVIATMSEGAREIVAENQTGRLVPIENVEVLAIAISELLSDRNERERLNHNAHHAVRERFSLERMVAATEQVYRGAVGDTSEARP
jgi:L-malate glycosyltransferase